MDQAKVNYAFAATFVDQLANSGVEHACVSPGSRSAPLAMALARHPRIRTWVHVDERAGSFFGLGLAKATGRPVALLCTSGTAAAEFHAAVLEASHSQTPLVVLTADRPPELIGVGANQAIDQRRLYGGAVRACFDPGPPREGAATEWRRLAARAVADALAVPPGPVHVNLALREPLVPAPSELPAAQGAPAVEVVPAPAAPTAEMRERLVAALRRARRPVLVAGEWREGGRARAAAARLGIPVLAEPSSHLRAADLPYEALLRDAAWAEAHLPDLVIRVGATPTSKPLNQWLAAAGARTVLVAATGWADPDRLATDVLRCDPAALLEQVAEDAGGGEAHAVWTEQWRAAARVARRAIDAALDTGPLHEGHAVRELARRLPPDAALFVGSSMPVRDVDAYWPATGEGQRFLGNRGASGIDGMVSTALGIAAADPARPAVALLGDLGLYHDMNGLWAARRHHLRATFVVLDNGGGGIFSFLPHAEHKDVFEEVFATPLGLRLEDVARLYGLELFAADTIAAVGAALDAALGSPGSAMALIRFSRQDSVEGHRATWRAVAEVLRGYR